MLCMSPETPPPPFLPPFVSQARFQLILLSNHSLFHRRVIRYVAPANSPLFPSFSQVCFQLGADGFIAQDLDDLIAVGKALNPAIQQFDASCFDGKYVTGESHAMYSLPCFPLGSIVCFLPCYLIVGVPSGEPWNAILHVQPSSHTSDMEQCGIWPRGTHRGAFGGTTTTLCLFALLPPSRLHTCLNL